MATISITIPDAVVPRITNAIAANGGWSPLLNDGSVNPLTKNAFSKKWLIDQILQQVRIYEVAQASQTAAATASDNVTSQIVIT
jgi:hypothetical protein